MSREDEQTEALLQRIAAYENGLACLEAYLSQFTDPMNELLVKMIKFWFMEARAENRKETTNNVSTSQV